MTKFEELCEIYTKAENDFYDYKWKCIDFAKTVGINVANYLGCKEEDILYYFYDKDDNPKETHLREALTLKSDTFWHYGIGINLYMVGDKNPSMQFILKMAIKGDKEGFIIEFPQLKSEFNINLDNLEDFKPLNHLIFNSIKDRYEDELRKFLKHQSIEHYPEYG